MPDAIWVGVGGWWMSSVSGRWKGDGWGCLCSPTGHEFFEPQSQQTCRGALKVTALETGSWRLFTVTRVQPIRGVRFWVAEPLVLPIKYPWPPSGSVTVTSRFTLNIQISHHWKKGQYCSIATENGAGCLSTASLLAYLSGWESPFSNFHSCNPAKWICLSSIPLSWLRTTQTPWQRSWVWRTASQYPWPIHWLLYYTGSGHATCLRFNRKGDYLASGRVRSLNRPYHRNERDIDPSY